MKYRESLFAIYGNNGEIITDDDVKANKFNDYFPSVYKLTGLPTEVNEVNLVPSGQQIELREEAVRKALSSIQPKKYFGIDGIPSTFYRKMQHTLVHPLLLLINRSLMLGRLPSEWLASKVIPIYKKGQRMDC